jgi:hypothetical protein
MVDAKGIPLAVVTAGADRHDSPLLAPTLEAAAEAKAAASSCLSRPASTSTAAYDSKKTRQSSSKVGAWWA